VRRPLLLAGLLGAVAALLRRSRTGRAERDLWTEATAPPDLR
jgi:hypothetical protein